MKAPFPLAFAAILAATIATLAPVDASPTTIRLTADRVSFYYNRFLVEADGNVRLSTSDGLVASGQAFSMDLKLNRFVLAGQVRIASALGAREGAAIADFLDFDRIYYLPVTTEPDRWTFLARDFAHPLLGREMPGDVFALPDLENDRPFLVAHAATIGEKSFVRFGPNRVDLAGGKGAYVPSPSYYVYFGANQYLGANSLSGANLDATYQVAGNANSIEAAHARYDTFNKFYLSYEQHVASDRAYAVFSVNPATRPSKFWNLMLSDFIGSKTQVQSFSQLHTYQYGLSKPYEASQFTNLQLTHALPRSFVQINWGLTNQSLLGTPANGFAFVEPSGAAHTYNPAHPQSVQIGANEFDHPLGRLPLSFRLRYGFGWAHDSFGLQSFEGTTYQTIWQRSVGLSAYTKSIRIGDASDWRRTYYFTGVSDKQRQWFNPVPHAIDTTNTTLTLTKLFAMRGAVYIAANIANVADLYRYGQRVAYPAFAPAQDPGYSAFAGQATFRTYSLGTVLTPTPDTQFAIALRQHVDFPRPIPNFFPPAQVNSLGQAPYPYYLGQPPYDVSLDARLRLNTHTSFEITNAYYFNYYGRRWSGLQVQLLP